MHRGASFRPSDRLIGRAQRLLAAHPYLAGSVGLHALLAALLISLPGWGEAERAMSRAASARHTAQQITQTEVRRLAYRVEHMEEILRQLADAAGQEPAVAPRPTDASPASLMARAKLLSAAIEAVERKLRVAALARLTGMPLADARREVDARAGASRPPNDAGTPAEAIEQLERRAKEALEAQRSQLEAQRHGVRVARAAPASTPANPEPGPAGQSRPADGIQRSLAVQLAAEFRHGPPQGRVGEPGFEGGRSVNPKRVEGVAGGRIAGADEQHRAARFGDGPPVRVPGGSLDLTGHAADGAPRLGAAGPAHADPAALRTGAGRVIGPGGPLATRVYLDSWYVIGPFDGRGDDPMQVVYPPEEHVDLDGSYRGQGGRTLGWHYASRGFYPFVPPEREERAVYYAYTELRVDEDRDVWLAIAADDDSMLWLDGRLVWTSRRGDKPWYRPPYYLPDEQVASLALAEGHRRVHLGRGVHRLLVKLFNDRDRTFFSVVLAP